MKKLLTQHFSGLVTKYKLLYVSNRGVGQGLGLGLGLGLDIVIYDLAKFRDHSHRRPTGIIRTATNEAQALSVPAVKLPAQRLYHQCSLSCFHSYFVFIRSFFVLLSL